MGLWRITKDGATIGHVAAPDDESSTLFAVMAKAELWGVVPPGHAHKYGAVWVPDDAIENEARQRIRSIPDLAAHEDELIAAAKRQTTRAVDALDHLSWLVWGNAAGIRHWIVGTTTGATV